MTVPIAFELVSMSGSAAAVTSTVSVNAPTVNVALTSVVFVACTSTASNTCDLKPCFETASLYVPNGKLTNVWVPEDDVSPLRITLVPMSRSSTCAPGTTLPLGSRTVTDTVPSDPCCEKASGTERIRDRTVATTVKQKGSTDLWDIRSSSIELEETDKSNVCLCKAA